MGSRPRTSANSFPRFPRQLRATPTISRPMSTVMCIRRSKRREGASRRERSRADGLNSQDTVAPIAKSGIHRVQYPQRQNGLVGLGLAMATVCAALPSVLHELATADGQRLVTLRAVDPGREDRKSVV